MLRRRLPTPLTTLTSLNCAASASPGRRATTRPSSAWRTSSATTSAGVGHHSRSPTTSTPIWTRTASRWATSDPWSTSRTRPTAPTRGAGLRTAERSSSDADPRVASATMHAEQRDLDIVLYGATGSVGKLVARYLARSGVRVGLAGRSSRRLDDLRQALPDQARSWPLIVADEGEPEALNRLAAQTRVMINTVGPYAAHGLPVVAACAAAGTDYIDLAAEVPFVRRSIDSFHLQAVESGARIVHSCGFDSIPSDLTVYALHRRVVEDGAGELAETAFVLRAANYAMGFSQGTIDTMFDLMRAGSGDPQTRQLLDDPYSLSPDRPAEPDLGPQPDVSLCRGEELAPEL